VWAAERGISQRMKRGKAKRGRLVDRTLMDHRIFVPGGGGEIKNPDEGQRKGNSKRRETRKNTRLSRFHLRAVLLPAGGARGR